MDRFDGERFEGTVGAYSSGTWMSLLTPTARDVLAQHGKG